MVHLASGSAMQMRPRRQLAGLLVLLLLAGCAPAAQERRPEGHVVFHSGTQHEAAASGPVIPGPSLRRVAILVPAFEPDRAANWAQPDRKTPGAGGAVVGLGFGMTLLQSTPLFLLAWPAAVGVMAGTTVLGAVGEFTGEAGFADIDAADRASLSEVANRLRPDPWLRQDVGEALARRMGGPPVQIPWYVTLGPDTPGTDPVAEARERSIDGILNVVVETFGLAVGEDEGSFGVFVRIRSQWIDTSTGLVRYQRILEQGPGHAAPGLPRPAEHALAFLALDRGLVFRHEVRGAIAGLARILAEDPALPIARKD